MLDLLTAMDTNVQALIALLEGEDTDRKARVTYASFLGFDTRQLTLACQAAIASGEQAVLCVFNPADITAGPRIGIAMADGDLIKLQFGELWLRQGGTRAVLVPRGVGKRFGHYAFDGKRFANRKGWPTEHLTAGTKRAAARLAMLNAVMADTL